MTIQLRGISGSLFLACVLSLVPVHISTGSVGYSKALANNAGGNGKGNGQGPSNAGDSGSGSAASVGTTAGKLDALHPSNLGRLNSLLNASSSAWQHAAVNSPMGVIKGEYATALNSFTDAAVPHPTADELAAILAKVANKESISPEVIGAINQRLLTEGFVTQAAFDAVGAVLAPPTGDPNAPTLTQLLAADASRLQASETKQGLGPIY